MAEIFQDGGSMKITRKQLRRIIKEERVSLLSEINWERLAGEIDVDPQIRTVGDLRKIIKTLQSDKRAKLGIEGLKDLGIGALADIIPGAGTVLSLGSTLKSMYSAPDDKKTNTMIDKLNVDDEVAAIVDDTVEDNFLEVALDGLEGLSDDADIPDINQKLADWLRSKYDARTVDGFQEGKNPFRQKRANGILIREFSKDVNSDELVWHRDYEDRYVKVQTGRGWQLQLENSLPTILSPGSTYFIPKKTYHRLIKGSKNLVVEIKEIIL